VDVQTILLGAFVVGAFAGCDAVFGITPIVTYVCSDAAAKTCRDATQTTNEDGDSDIDGCDPCPQDPGASIDSDGDGVGDTCDPDPSTAGDAIVLFDGFASDLHYTTTTLSWNHMNGEYFQTQAIDSRSTMAIQIDVPAVDAAFSSITAGDNHGAGVSLEIGASQIDCAHIHRGMPVPDELVLFANGAIIDRIDLSVQGALRLQLRQNRDGSLDCTGRSSTAIVRVHGAPLDATTGTAFGFVTFAATATIDAVTVFDKHDVPAACGLP
jgi:hypothetical protein